MIVILGTGKHFMIFVLRCPLAHKIEALEKRGCVGVWCVHLSHLAARMVSLCVPTFLGISLIWTRVGEWGSALPNVPSLE